MLCCWLLVLEFPVELFLGPLLDWHCCCDEGDCISEDVVSLAAVCAELVLVADCCAMDWMLCEADLLIECWPIDLELGAGRGWAWHWFALNKLVGLTASRLLITVGVSKLSTLLMASNLLVACSFAPLFPGDLIPCPASISLQIRA